MNLILLWRTLSNEVLGDADPNDRGRFAILSSNFDRAFEYNVSTTERGHWGCSR